MYPNNLTNMKILIAFILLIVTVSNYSCDKNEVIKEYPYEAKVLGNNSDCGIFAIQITSGLDNAIGIVGNSVSEGIYIAKNLPVELQTVGLNIVLDIRKPKATELGACLYHGLTYNWLYVTKAKLK
jgi:hypothetical protein